MLDRETLLAPIAPEEPSGPLLEYDPAFLGLAEAARGKPEQRMGDAVIAAEPPDWGKVERDAVALLARTKDLRLAVLLVKARLRTGGLAGLAEGLAILRSLLEQRWDTVHPQLDAEDGDDPSIRISAIADLADADTVLAVRNAEVASARGVGRIRVRDLEPPQGGNGASAPAGDGAPEKPPPVDAVFAACDVAALAAISEGAAAAVADARAIEAFVREKAGADRWPDLGKVVALLKRVGEVAGERVAARGASVGATDGPVAAGGAPAGSAAIPGTIGSRNDVLAALDAICAYYERFEPSSPIPLLMKRSKRLVAMSFIDIVRDVMPDALPQAEGLRGRSEGSGHEVSGPTSRDGGAPT